MVEVKGRGGGQKINFKSFAPPHKFQGLEKNANSSLLCRQSARIFFAKRLRHFLLGFGNILFREWLAWNFTHWARKLKNYLPSKKIYLSWTTGQVFCRALPLGQAFCWKFPTGAHFLRIEVARKSEVTPRERTFWCNKHLKWSANTQEIKHFNCLTQNLGYAILKYFFLTEGKR